MIATKEQEMAALAKIKKIVAELGSGSYLSFAFDGCFQDAEENIKNDFSYSMKNRYEKAKSDAEYFQKEANHEAAEHKKIKEECERLRKCTISKKVAEFLLNIVNEETGKLRLSVEDAANSIVEHADNPNSDEFSNAVSKHRSLKTKLEQERVLIEVLSGIIHAYDEVSKSAKEGV